MVVPGNGSDTFAGRYTQRAKRIGQPACAPCAIGIGVAEQGAMRFTRDDFHVAVLQFRMLDDR